jgi:hypothetical protein
MLATAGYRLAMGEVVESWRHDQEILVHADSILRQVSALGKYGECGESSGLKHQAKCLH